jgi:hypothetical protein
MRFAFNSLVPAHLLLNFPIKTVFIIEYLSSMIHNFLNRWKITSKQRLKKRLK